ncbi:type 4a pilus biogenesis protein PilO [Candidatus Uhrbacteria bacterium]|nr:type 4a pilus biogenesis protein PilO [Candidatus Uhrbacteria bacterium]
MVRISQKPGEKQKKAAPEIKKPSRVFTEYYSSIILILITILIGAGYFVIKPKIDEYKDLRAHSESLRQNIKNEQTYLAGLRRSVNAAQSIAPGVLEKVDQALPRSFSIPKTIVLINSAATASNVSVSSIVFSPETESRAKKTSLQSVQMTLNVSAPDYAALKNFLNTLEASLRLIDIQMLTVSDFSEGQASFSLQLRTYYYPKDETK